MSGMFFSLLLALLAASALGLQCDQPCSLSQCLQQRCAEQVPFLCLEGAQRNQCSRNVSFCLTGSSCCDWRTCSLFANDACTGRCPPNSGCNACAEINPFFDPASRNCAPDPISVLAPSCCRCCDTPRSCPALPAPIVDLPADAPGQVPFRHTVTFQGFEYCLSYVNDASRDLADDGSQRWLGWIPVAGRNRRSCLDLRTTPVRAFNQDGFLMTVTNPQGRQAFLCNSESVNTTLVGPLWVFFRVLYLDSVPASVTELFSDQRAAMRCFWSQRSDNGRLVSLRGQLDFGINNDILIGARTGFCQRCIVPASSGGMCGPEEGGPNAWEFRFACSRPPYYSVPATVLDLSATRFEPTVGVFSGTEASLKPQLAEAYSYLAAASSQWGSRAFPGAYNATAGEWLCARLQYWLTLSDQTVLRARTELLDIYSVGCATHRNLLDSLFARIDAVPHVIPLSFERLQDLTARLLDRLGRFENVVQNAIILDEQANSLTEQLADARALTGAYVDELARLGARADELTGHLLPVAQGLQDSLGARVRTALANREWREAERALRAGAIAGGALVACVVSAKTCASGAQAIFTQGINLVQQLVQEVEFQSGTRTDPAVQALRSTAVLTRVLVQRLQNLASLPVSKDLPSLVPKMAGQAEDLRVLSQFLPTFGAYLQTQGFSTALLSNITELLAIRETAFNLHQQWFDQAVVYSNLQIQLRTVKVARSLIESDVLGVNTTLPAAQNALRLQIFQWISYEIAALQFFSLQAPNVRVLNSLNSMTFNVLSTVHFDLATAWARAKRDFSSAAFTAGYARAIIQRTDSVPLFVNNSLSFSLTWPRDANGEPRLSWYNARVLGAEAMVDFRPNSSCVPLRRIRFNLQRSGYSTIFDSNRNPVSFTHPTASWESFSRTFCDGASSCIDTFSGVAEDGVWYSPFGAWVLNVIQPLQPIDLSGVERVTITLTVSAFSLRSQDLPLFGSTEVCDQSGCDFPLRSPECPLRRETGDLPAPALRPCTPLYGLCNVTLPCCNDGFCLRHTVSVGCTGENIVETFRCVPPLSLQRNQ